VGSDSGLHLRRAHPRRSAVTAADRAAVSV
jgi:hypothetical protein